MKEYTREWLKEKVTAMKIDKLAEENMELRKENDFLRRKVAVLEMQTNMTPEGREGKVYVDAEAYWKLINKES